MADFISSSYLTALVSSKPKTLLPCFCTMTAPSIVAKPPPMSLCVDCRRTDVPTYRNVKVQASSSSSASSTGFESVLGGQPRGGTSDGNTSAGEGIAGPSLERIVLSIARDATCDPVECIQLVPLSSEVDGKTSTLVDSPDGTGTFRRTKCKVTLLNGTSTASTLVVPSSAGVSAKIFHDGSGHTSTMLELESIDLPATKSGVKAKKEWRQLGSLGENLVVQLGFKLLSSGKEDDDAPPQWTLSQAFVSQPV